MAQSGVVFTLRRLLRYIRDLPDVIRSVARVLKG